MCILLHLLIAWSSSRGNLAEKSAKPRAIRHGANLELFEKSEGWSVELKLKNLWRRPNAERKMKNLLWIMMVVILASPVFASEWRPTRLVMGYSHEENPVNCYSGDWYVSMSFSDSKTKASLVLEDFTLDADGYDRYTVYVGGAKSSTSFGYRWDNVGGEWLVLSQDFSLSKKVSMTVRPLKGLGDAPDRVYTFTNYSNGHWGAMLYTLSIQHYESDVVAAFTYQNGKISVWAGPNIMKNGCWDGEIDYVISF